MEKSPFHQGELEAQKKVGVDKIAEGNGRMINDRIPNGALKFIDKQPMFIVSSLDNEKNIWTSILAGKPGFLTALDEQNVKIDLSAIVSSRLDPFWENINNNPNVGMLFIELATRRRLRINGSVSISDKHIIVSVKQAYPNCPKYIQRREIELTNNNTGLDILKNRGTTLTDDLRKWIKSADTFFVGSANEKDELDASHRGGSPGFIKILDNNTLQIPDYQGNSMFNTLGNFIANPKAGLLFVDFQSGKTLQLIGNVEIVWDEDGAQELTGQTRRLWKFYITEWLEVNSLNGINWNFIDYSPFNP